MNVIKKEAVTTYTDHRYRPTKLTEEELNWFYSQVEQAKRATGCAIDILPYDHDLYEGKSKDALGCCVSDTPENPLADEADSYITIDCYFIHECFRNEYFGDFLIAGQNLNEVIAHEIAHLYIWRHGKKHTAKTQEILLQILEISKKGAAA